LFLVIKLTQKLPNNLTNIALHWGRRSNK
jgi:hypothetical protein